MTELSIQQTRATVTLKWRAYGAAVGGIALVTAALSPLQKSLSSTTVALAFLLVVLLVAIYGGSRPAMVSALLGVLAFNFFFLPPLHTFTIADSQNWVALGAFLVTALTVGQLSARARAKADEAERQRKEIEQLYSDLKTAIDKVSEAEALRRSEQLKSALLDAVTHDIRTPLTSIKAAVTALLDDEKTEEFQLDAEGKKEFLEIINEETDRLNHFTEGLVELARQEARAVVLQRIWCSVEEIFAAALERAKVRRQSHRIEVNIETDLTGIRVDAKAIAQVVYTLLENAAKYSPPGTRIKLIAQQTGAGMVQIAVEDEGRGIPLEMRERVFEKFFRVTMDAKQAVGGLGLGLAIARGIVASHGGKIWITAGVNNRGTRVIFTVPIGDEES